MKGSKRLAASDSTLDTSDAALLSKRIIAGSQFHGHRIEPAEQKLDMMPPLDVHRAESSRQHVRALNTQFASWVQSQLKNHPDELWEDGVRDYLSHASNIMEKFSDVVNWIKANAAGGGSTTESVTVEKNLVPDIKDNGNKLLRDKTWFAPASTNGSFATSWSSGVFSNNQSSAGVFTNSQSSSVLSSSQNSPIFSYNQSSGPLTSSQNSGLFSNSQNSGLFSNNSGLLSNSQSSGSFSKGQSSGLFSNSQSSGLSSNSQSSGFFSNNPSFGLFSNNQSTGLFSNSHSTGVFSNSQIPVLFGSQNPVSTNPNPSDDADDENEPQQPSSPSLKKTEEKDIVVVHEVKCKLYVKSSDPADKDAWKDRGTGHLSIKCQEGVSKGTRESKPTVVVRNDVGKILLNALIYPGIKTSSQKNSLVAIFHTAGDDGADTAVARTFLIRTKTEEDRDKLATAIQEHAPAS